MPRIKDITGQRFSAWTVLRQTERRSSNYGVYWLCRCVCGVEREVLGNTLRDGQSQSCGCQQNHHVTHGASKRGRATKTYRAWLNMRRRCDDPNRPEWKNYGGRGITVCERWQTFENFLADMGDASPNLTLDRIDNSLGYFKANCRWTDRFAQSQNRRRKGPQKLEAAQVLLIRSDLRPYPAVAAQFGISVSHVCRIKNRKQWAHL